MPVARSTIQACLKRRRQPVVMAATDDVTDEAGAAAFGLSRVETSSDEGSSRTGRPLRTAERLSKHRVGRSGGVRYH
jgi:hypothetical protein